MIGFFQVTFGILASWIVKTFGRRPLIIWGHIGMGISHISLGILNNNHYDIGVLSMIIVFISIYSVTSGTVAWLYAAETTIDAGLGVCILVLWGVTFVLSLICPLLMGDNYLGVSNMFFLFGSLTSFGSVYGHFLIKETKGMTDKEKKSLYSPK
jgi:MFS transporter, SP family, xylose:H+ symportor